MTEDEKKGHIKPFGFLKGQLKTPESFAVPEKTYVKEDGTKVTERQEEYGTSVTELCVDGTLIARFYDRNEVLRQDYIRKLNIELVHHFDEFGVMTDELTNVYDEHNILAKQTEKAYEYHDNGKKAVEEILESPSDIKTTIKYNINGEFTEKVVQRGTMKTWYDINDKPFKREIDRGSGGIIKEDLK